MSIQTSYNNKLTHIKKGQNAPYQYNSKRIIPNSLRKQSYRHPLPLIW